MKEYDKYYKVMNKLNPQEIQSYLENQYHNYAYERINGEPLSLEVNYKSNYRVTYDGKLLYSGKKLSNAIKAYETVETVEDEDNFREWDLLKAWVQEHKVTECYGRSEYSSVGYHSLMNKIEELSNEENYNKKYKDLYNAVKKHRDNFPDEPLEGERELWSLLEKDEL